MRSIVYTAIGLGLVSCGSVVIDAEETKAPEPIPADCVECSDVCGVPSECAEAALMCGGQCVTHATDDACPSEMHAVLCEGAMTRADCMPVDAPMCSTAYHNAVASCCADDGRALQGCWSDNSCPQPREECLVSFCELGRCRIEAVPNGYGCAKGACLNGFCGAI